MICVSKARAQTLSLCSLCVCVCVIHSRVVSGASKWLTCFCGSENSCMWSLNLRFCMSDLRLVPSNISTAYRRLNEWWHCGRVLRRESRLLLRRGDRDQKLRGQGNTGEDTSGLSWKEGCRRKKGRTCQTRITTRQVKYAARRGCRHLFSRLN